MEYDDEDEDDEDDEDEDEEDESTEYSDDETCTKPRNATVSVVSS